MVERRGVRWGVIAVAGVVAAMLGLAAFLFTTARVPRVEQTRELVDSFDRVARVVVDTDSAGVQVDGSTASDRATVRTRLRWNTGDQPPYLVQLDGDTLRVRLRGCGLRVFGAFCDANVALTVPAGVSLTVDSDSGNVAVVGVGGSVRLLLDSGNADLRDVAGEVTAAMDSGNLAGTGLTSTAVRAESDSGSVSLQFAAMPGNVLTRTESGQVDILLPAGSGPYAVRTDTDSGQSRIDVATGATAGHQIEAATDSGDITIGYQSV
jgi:hypothetical protein